MERVVSRWLMGAGPLARAWLRGQLSYDRNVYLMLLFTLGKGLQLSIASITVNLYAYSLGYRETFLGLLTAVPAIGSLLAAVPMGLLADRIGRKPLVILGGLLNPLSLLMLGLSTQAPWLLVASFFNGILSSAYWVTNLPILTESAPEDQRVGVLAANNFLLLGVGALGSLIGGGVPQLIAGALHVAPTRTLPLRWGVLVASLVTFLPALPLFLLRESRHREAHRKEAAHPLPAVTPPDGAGAPAAQTIRRAANHRAADPVAADPPPLGRRALVILFAKLLIPDALYTTGEASALALLSIYFVRRFTLDPGPLGVFLTIAGLVGGATSFAAPRLARRWGKLRAANVSQFLSVPAVLTIGFAPAFMLAAPAEVARGVLRGLFEPTYAAFTMEQVSSRTRATLSGFYSVTWSIGFSMGSLLAGWLFQHVSYSAPFLVSAVLIAAAATLLRLWFGARRADGKALSIAENPTDAEEPQRV